MGAGIGEGEGSGRGGSPLWMVVWFLLLWFIGETDLTCADFTQETRGVVSEEWHRCQEEIAEILRFPCCVSFRQGLFTSRFPFPPSLALH